MQGYFIFTVACINQTPMVTLGKIDKKLRRDGGGGHPLAIAA